MSEARKFRIIFRDAKDGSFVGSVLESAKSLEEAMEKSLTLYHFKGLTVLQDVYEEEAEVAGECRLGTLLRIHSRYNRVRALEERRAYLRVAEERGVVNPSERAKIEGGGHGS